MTETDNAVFKLADAIDEALSLLKDYALPDVPAPTSGAIPSLLEQCERLLAEAELAQPQPVRTLHHFACTGGTLISKCIAATPNTVLLSEIDPLSHFYTRSQNKRFAPTDLIAHLHNNIRPLGDEFVKDMFLSSVQSLHTSLSGQGRRLVLRDHAHSQYCSDLAHDARPTLKKMLSDVFPTLSCVSVRHPIDSFLALIANKWFHFSPFTLEEYCQRYTAFLNDYAGTPVFYYEDFVAHPHEKLSEICDILDLPYTANVFDVIGVIDLSGDSGRSSAEIAPRPRREVPDDMRRQAEESPSYHALCRRLGYNPKVDAQPLTSS